MPATLDFTARREIRQAGIFSGCSSSLSSAEALDFSHRSISLCDRHRQCRQAKKLSAQLGKLWRQDLFTKRRLDLISGQKVSTLGTLVYVSLAIEIATALGKVPKPKTKKPTYDKLLTIGLTQPPDILKEKSTPDSRKGCQESRLVKEVRNLHRKGVSRETLRTTSIFENTATSLFISKRNSREKDNAYAARKRNISILQTPDDMVPLR